jgi:hypothetical protein
LLRPNTGLKDQGRVLFIGDRRFVSMHASGRRGSALASLLEQARKDFRRDHEGIRTAFAETYQETLAVLRTPEVQDIETAIEETAKQMLGFLGQRVVADLEIGFGFADPRDPYSSLTIVCKEGDLELPAESMGLGIQDCRRHLRRASP